MWDVIVQYLWCESAFFIYILTALCMIATFIKRFSSAFIKLHLMSMGGSDKAQVIMHVLKYSSIAIVLCCIIINPVATVLAILLTMFVPAIFVTTKITKK